MQKRTVRRKEISSYSVKKNKGPMRIISLGSVYLFNGYGWVEECIATPEDLKKYPHLVEDKQ